MSQRKQKLMSEVGLLNTQTNYAINEYERLVKEIEHEEQYSKDLKIKLDQAAEDFEREEREEHARQEKIQKEKEERVGLLKLLLTVAPDIRHTRSREELCPYRIEDPCIES